MVGKVFDIDTKMKTFHLQKAEMQQAVDEAHLLNLERQEVQADLDEAFTIIQVEIAQEMIEIAKRDFTRESLFEPDVLKTYVAYLRRPDLIPWEIREHVMTVILE